MNGNRPDPASHDRAPSARTTVRRHPERARYGEHDVVAVVDEALFCHVGVCTPQGPLVLPMAHGRVGGTLYLHGAPANGVLAEAMAEVCVTFTLLDGLVLARTAFHNSLNYRSVVVRGAARRVEGGEKAVALAAVSDHVLPTWDQGRPPAPSEIRRTLVVAVDLAEASAKVRTGDPVDDEADIGGPWWAGVLPVETHFGEPVPAEGLHAGAEVPARVGRLAGRPATGRAAPGRHR